MEKLWNERKIVISLSCEFEAFFLLIFAKKHKKGLKANLRANNDGLLLASSFRSVKRFNVH